jgi:hypothetical protein
MHDIHDQASDLLLIQIIDGAEQYRPWGVSFAWIGKKPCGLPVNVGW